MTARLLDRRQAEKDVAPHLSHINQSMAFDSAESAYCAALVELGVSRADVSGLSLAGLKVLLKTVERSGGAPNMAYDASDGSPILAAILKDVPAPRVAR